ncbi:flagellar hook-basal body complex protein [Magnetospira sp. QH-2]|uniref:flagellar hook-basal body complex protein n=1 Tax=Magnetospira sp. (strain QH-2) TaxID=1288970 RepID=UPI0003E81637|nr:flagellar hook-basal body complex protein [Magnetospira sp. QH-2]CCQ73052.1 putative Flagellar hook protein FlgE [Magnetospira sp. QH-2]
MSLYGALFSGVSGLQSQSSSMGAIADNVTNVNTVGYKRTEVQFQTLITKQVSLTKYAAGGVQSKPLAGIDVQGLLQATSSATDIALSGQGMFIVNEASTPSTGDIFAYSRAGSFRVDEAGYLQNTSGWYLQGWPIQTWDNSTQAVVKTIGSDVYMKAYKNDAGDTVYINDNIVDNTNLKPLNLNTIGGTATATTTISMGANLPSSDEPGDSHKTDILIYDSLGNSHNINHTWVKRASNAWDYTAIPPKGSERLLIEDQTSARNNYYSAGRLDFDTIPDSGTSMTVSINSSTYTVLFTTSDTSTVDDETLALASQPEDGETIVVTANGTATTFEFNNGSPNSMTVGSVPTDGETITLTIGGTPYTYEFDPSGDGVSAGNRDVNGGTVTAIGNNLAALIGTDVVTVVGAGVTTDYANSAAGVISFTNIPGATKVVFSDGTGGDVTTTEFTSGRTPVTIGPNTNSTTANLASAINTQLTTDLGTAGQQWATVNGTTISIKQTLYNTTAEVISLANSVDSGGGAGVVTAGGAGAPNTSLNIDITGRSLSQIMDEVADRLQGAMHYEYGGTPKSPPDAWATRLAGESSVYFIQGSAANAITVDASNLTTNGVSSVMQNTSFSVDSLDASVAWTTATNYAVEFNGDGTPDKFFGADEATAADPRAQYQVAWANGADDMDGSTTPALSVGLGNYNTSDGLTQFAGSYQINYISQNGASFGNYAGISIGEDGVVTALFDNGVTKPVFMVPVATLVNPNGMESMSGNVWIETDQSGQPTVREAGDGGAGQVASASLEASTVDLGEEFTSMITTQRAYSASTKIITTADEMLEELMRVKR